MTPPSTPTNTTKEGWKWSVSALRRWLRTASTEEFQSDADLLTPHWTGADGAWLAMLVLSIPALAGVALSHNVVLHVSFAFTVMCVLPTIALAVVRRTYGPNASISLAIMGVLAVSSPNLLLATGLVRVLPPLRELAAGWPWWSAGVLGYVPPLLVCAALTFRYRVLNEMRGQVDFERQRAAVAQSARATSEAHLKALQAQIEPHFLYNTLANVQQLVRTEPSTADEMLQGLIRYLRAAVPKLREANSTLGQEFALSAAYLDIMRLRYGGRLGVTVSLPPELNEIAFPPLIVQTLVENAIKHGVEPKTGQVEVALTAKAAGESVEISVTDDGVGLNPDNAMGTGLRNTRERLTAIYGDSARFNLAPNVPTGVRASVRFPRAVPGHS